MPFILRSILSIIIIILFFCRNCIYTTLVHILLKIIGYLAERGEMFILRMEADHGKGGSCGEKTQRRGCGRGGRAVLRRGRRRWYFCGRFPDNFEFSSHRTNVRRAVVCVRSRTRRVEFDTILLILAGDAIIEQHYPAAISDGKVMVRPCFTLKRDSESIRHSDFWKVLAASDGNICRGRRHGPIVIQPCLQDHDVGTMRHDEERRYGDQKRFDDGIHVSDDRFVLFQYQRSEEQNKAHLLNI